MSFAPVSLSTRHALSGIVNMQSAAATYGQAGAGDAGAGYLEVDENDDDDDDDDDDDEEEEEEADE